MENENKFVDGMFFNPKNEKAPEFVRGGISFHKEQFMNWLQKQEANDKGYIKTDMLLSKQNKIYFKLNDWKPEKSFNPTEEIVKEDLSNQSPF